MSEAPPPLAGFLVAAAEEADEGDGEGGDGDDAADGGEDDDAWRWEEGATEDHGERSRAS